MSETHYIYALVDPRTGQAAYIGYTNNPTKRLAQHMRQNDNPRRDKWVTELLKNGLKPAMQVLEIVSSVADAKKCETAWINWYLEQGVSLTNSVYPGCKKPPYRRLGR